MSIVCKMISIWPSYKAQVGVLDSFYQTRKEAWVISPRSRFLRSEREKLHFCTTWHYTLQNNIVQTILVTKNVLFACEIFRTIIFHWQQLKEKKNLKLGFQCFTIGSACITSQKNYNMGTALAKWYFQCLSVKELAGKEVFPRHESSRAWVWAFCQGALWA